MSEIQSHMLLKLLLTLRSNLQKIEIALSSMKPSNVGLIKCVMRYPAMSYLMVNYIRKLESRRLREEEIDTRI